MQADSEVEEVRPGFDVDVGGTDEQRNYAGELVFACVVPGMCERERCGRACKSENGVYATLLYTRWCLDICHVDVGISWECWLDVWYLEVCYLDV